MFWNQELLWVVRTTMETQISFQVYILAVDFGLCLSQDISMAVHMLSPGWNSCLSKMMFHLLAELRETSEESGGRVTVC